MLITMGSNMSAISYVVHEKPDLKYKKIGNAFVRKHRREHTSGWLNDTKWHRSAIDPALFEYYERRAAGIEPEPTNYTFPMAPNYKRYNLHIRQLRFCREAVAFREIDWNKGFSYRDGKSAVNKLYS